jgi:hypothetical protein
MPAKDTKAYMKQYYQDNQEKYKEACRASRRRAKIWLYELKKTLNCVKCGNIDYRVLQFHHIGKKSFGIWEGVSKGYAIATIQKEIEQCIVLCANCHTIEHHVELT